jgi:hypothetical protein
MLVNFFTIEVAASTTNFGDFVNALGQTHMDASGANIPNYTCLYFSADISRYVFCLDASIDAAAICNANNFPYNFAHSEEVADDLYCREARIGIDGPNKYELFKIIVHPPIDMSGGIPMPINHE